MRRHEEHEGAAAAVGIGHLLLPGERLVAHPGAATFDRRQPRRQRRPVGDLYLTSARLLFVGSPMASIPLESIEDAILVGDRIQLMVRGGVGVSIDVDRPRLLREQIAAARATRREAPNDPSEDQPSPR
jgi:hypothetical protein